MSDHPVLTPTRLWAAVHADGCETWIAQQDDGTYAGWACLAGGNAASFYVEDTFNHAAAAALFQLRAIGGHDGCTPDCGAWAERELPAPPSIRP